MSRRFVQELTDGETIDEVYLVSEKQLRANRNGNLFLQLEIRDRTGGISARMWNAGEALFRSFEEGDFLRIKGKVQLFQGTLQIIANQIERIGSDAVPLADFLPHTEQDVSKLYEKLRSILMRLGNPHLRALIECFLMDDDFVRNLCRAPAGIRQHHAYIGGLLEHVVNMLEVADKVMPFYPEVDRDLVLTGIFFHDIGKVRELNYSRVFSYSDEGQLIGHLIIGVEMINEKAAKVPDLTGEPFPQELLLRVKHMVLSHHGTYEFGSPKLPMTPEAIALHFLDNLDAKINMFTREIREDSNRQSTWTPFHQNLQRRLFKGGVQGEDEVESDDYDEGLE